MFFVAKSGKGRSFAFHVELQQNGSFAMSFMPRHVQSLFQQQR